MRGSALFQAIPALLPLSSVLLSSLLFTSAPVPVLAGSQKIGENCTGSDSRLEAGTFAFFDDCDTHAFCNDTTKLCEHKHCRKDIFPFGFDTGSTLPKLCDKGTFCPDEQSDCIPLLPVGSGCQLNRDDMCEPPPNFQELRDEKHRGLNVNGSVCLNNICMWANVTAGQTCVLENTAYIAYEASGNEYINIVSRGNCITGTWCDAQTLKCQPAKALGDSCDADKECDSFNCGTDGKCGKDASLPRQVAMWVYIIVAVLILVGMVGTLVALFFVHRKNRDIEREKRAQYWREQYVLRQNLLQMQETAKQIAPAHGYNSNNNGAGSVRSTMYGSEDGFAAHGFVQGHGGQAGSGSGGAGHRQGSSALRNAYSDDGEMSDDAPITHEPSRNRF